MGERKSAMENMVNPWLSRYVLIPYLRGVASVPDEYSQA
jgi:hypothetical protein